MNLFVELSRRRVVWMVEGDDVCGFIVLVYIVCIVFMCVFVMFVREMCVVGVYMCDGCMLLIVGDV